MQFSYKKQTERSFEEALAKTRVELEKEGFGVITEINVTETFKKKLAIDFESYVILGACHPESALAVLEENKELGLMLPCNVIVYAEKEKVFVSTILPTTILNVTGDEKLLTLAEEIEGKLKKVMDSI